MANVETFPFGDRHTPKQTLLSCLSEVEDAKIAIVIYLDKDDYIETAWSDGSLLKRLGLLYMAADRMKDIAAEEQDG